MSIIYSTYFFINILITNDESVRKSCNGTHLGFVVNKCNRSKKVASELVASENVIHVICLYYKNQQKAKMVIFFSVISIWDISLLIHKYSSFS